MFFAEPREVFWPHSGADALTVAQSLLNYFVYMVIIIVVAVPEGLPMSVTVSLALAMRKMTQANSLVRQLVACETIGSATVICSDKTGTLTQNKMQVVRLFWDGVTRDRDTPGWVRAGRGLAVAARRPAARLDRPQRRRQLDRQPGGETGQDRRRGQHHGGCASPVAGRGRPGLPQAARPVSADLSDPFLLRTQTDDDRGAGRRAGRGAGQGFAGVAAGTQHALPDGRRRRAGVDAGSAREGAGGAARLLRTGHANAGLRPLGAAGGLPHRRRGHGDPARRAGDRPRSSTASSPSATRCAAT